MDPYDDTQHGHPSQSIHNAAYPDAPYQPGQGQQPQGRDQNQLRLDTNSSPSTYDHSQSYPLSSHPSSSRHTRSPSSQWSDHAAPRTAVASPQDPPPPYAARQPPQPANSYSTLNGSLLANQSSSSSDGGHLGPMIPMQPIQSYSSSSIPDHFASNNSYYAPPTSSMHQSYLAQQQHRQQQQPHLLINNDDVLVPTATAPGKPVPLSDAKWRKRRRLRICLIAITLLVILFVALTVGVAWKVFDLGHSPSDDPPHP